MIDYKSDGIDHINVYSRAKTPLGRFLSNFAQAELETEDGSFTSVEGYWYWLLCNNETKSSVRERETLREVFGFDAKNLGKSLRDKYGLSEVNIDEDFDFQKKIKNAIKFKIDNHPQYKAEFIRSILPFEHYYVFYGKIKEPSLHRWVIDYLTELRQEYRESLHE